MFTCKLAKYKTIFDNITEPPIEITNSSDSMHLKGVTDNVW